MLCSHSMTENYGNSLPPIGVTTAESCRERRLLLARNMSAAASFCCVSLSVAWAAWTINESAEIHLWRDPTERWILVLVFFAYVLAWLPVALLPYDIGNNITGNCTHDPTIRGRWWALLYVANLFTGYVANDYARSYIYSGAFTIRRKMAEGWRILWTWYAWAGLAILPLLLLIAWNNRFSLSAWQLTYESIYAVANLYGILTMLAFVLTIPFAFYFEGATLASTWAASAAVVGTPWLIKNIIINGMYYYLYNEVAFITLNKVAPITHSIANTIKRVVIIVATCLVFHNPMSRIGVIGSSIAIAGTFLYSYAKQKWP